VKSALAAALAVFVLAALFALELRQAVLLAALTGAMAWVLARSARR